MNGFRIGGLLLTFLSFNLTTSAVAAQSLATVAEPFITHHLGWRQAQYNVRKNLALQFNTGDVILRGDLYSPDKPTPSPTLLVRIPLDQNKTGRFFSELMGYFFARRGYNVFIQGVRGRYGSTGRHWPFQHEREDGISTLRWIQKQPWHTGKIGMWGGSYFGHTQWVISDQKALGLGALAIQIASSNHHTLFFPGGALAYETALRWGTRAYSDVDTPLSHTALLEAMQSGEPLNADLRSVGQKIPFYREWLSHPQRDAYWQAADGKNRALEANVPVLLMAGWYDPYLPGQLADYKTLQQSSPFTAYTSRLIIGPWSHAETMTLPDGFVPQHYRLASIAPVLDWYDHHIMGKSFHGFAPVQAFVSGINQWRSFKDWPPTNTQATPFYLTGNTSPLQGILQRQPPKAFRKYRYTHDPQNPVPSEGGAILLGTQSGPKRQTSHYRNDVLRFDGQMLKEPLTLLGEPRANLWFSSSAPAGDVVVKLIDVHPDGSAYGISQGIVRTHFMPEKPQKVTVALWAVGHTFLKGHRLRVEVASSHFPMFNVHPGTAENPLTARHTRKSLQTLWTGSQYSSTLELPVNTDVTIK